MPSAPRTLEAAHLVLLLIVVLPLRGVRALTDGAAMPDLPGIETWAPFFLEHGDRIEDATWLASLVVLALLAREHLQRLLLAVLLVWPAAWRIAPHAVPEASAWLAVLVPLWVLRTEGVGPRLHLAAFGALAMLAPEPPMALVLLPLLLLFHARPFDPRDRKPAIGFALILLGHALLAWFAPDRVSATMGRWLAGDALLGSWRIPLAAASLAGLTALVLAWRDPGPRRKVLALLALGGAPAHLALTLLAFLILPPATRRS